MRQLLAITIIVLFTSTLLFTACANTTAPESAVNTENNTANSTQLANTEVTTGVQYQAFACVVDDTGKVYWKTGLDTTDSVIKEFSLNDDNTTVKVTVTPDNGEKYPYLYPNEPWKLTVVDDTTPDWFNEDSKTAVMSAFEQWKAEVYSFDLEAFMNPPDPTTIAPHEPTEEDIGLFKEWIASGGNPRNMVMKSVSAGIGSTVANQLWDYLNTEYWSGVMNRANVGSVVTKLSGAKNVGAVQEGQFAAYFGSYFADLMSGDPSRADRFGGGEWSDGSPADGGNSNDGENTDADLAGREGMGNPEDGGPDRGTAPQDDGSSWADSKKSDGDPSRADGYEYSAAVTLINHGFIVSSDATTWRLHNAADGSVVYEITAAELSQNEDRGFTAIVSESGETYWKAGVDSGDQLMKLYNLTDDGSYFKVLVVPDNDKKYPYLYPDLPWKTVVSEDKPDWYTQTHEDAVMTAFAEWKSYVYNFDLDGFLDFFENLQMEPVQPTESDIALLKEWATVNVDGKSANATPDSSYQWVGKSIWGDAESYLNDAFGEAYGQCPGPTVCHGIETSLGIKLDPAVEDLIGSTVGEKALVGSFFTNTEKWKSTDSATYPYQACAELWKRGFIASFDGENWRLSSGKDGTVVYQISAKELLGQ